MLVAQLIGHQAFHSQKTGNTKGIVHVSLFLLFPAACAASILYYRRFFPSRQWSHGLWKNFLRQAAAPILFFAPAGPIRPGKNICLRAFRHWKAQKRRAAARRFGILFTYLLTIRP